MQVIKAPAATQPSTYFLYANRSLEGCVSLVSPFALHGSAVSKILNTAIDCGSGYCIGVITGTYDVNVSGFRAFDLEFSIIVSCPPL